MSKSMHCTIQQKASFSHHIFKAVCIPWAGLVSSIRNRGAGKICLNDVRQDLPRTFWFVHLHPNTHGEGENCSRPHNSWQDIPQNRESRR